MQLMLQGYAHCSCQLDNEAARFTTTPFTGQPFLTDPEIEGGAVPRQFPMEEKTFHDRDPSGVACCAARHDVAHPQAVAQLIWRPTRENAGPIPRGSSPSI